MNSQPSPAARRYDDVDWDLKRPWLTARFGGGRHSTKALLTGQSTWCIRSNYADSLTPATRLTISLTRLRVVGTADGSSIAPAR